MSFLGALPPVQDKKINISDCAIKMIIKKGIMPATGVYEILESACLSIYDPLSNIIDCQCIFSWP